MNCEKCGSPLVEENGNLVCKNCSNAQVEQINEVPATVEVSSTPEVVIEPPVVEVQSPVVEVSEAPVEVVAAPEVVVEAPVMETPVVEVSAAPVEVVASPEVAVEAPVMETPAVEVSAEPIETAVTPEITLENPVMEAPVVENPAMDVQPVAEVSDGTAMESANVPEVSMMSEDTVIESIESQEVKPEEQAVTLEANTPSDAPVAPESKKGGKSKALIIIICIVVLLGIVAGVGVFFYNKMMDSKGAFTKLTSSVLATYKESMNKSTKPNKLTFNYSSEVKASEDYKVISDFLNKLKLSGSVSTDINNKVANMNLDIKYNNSQFVNADFYFQDNKGYAFLNGLYEKYLDLEVDDTVEGIFKNNNDAYYNLVEDVLMAVDNTFTESDFTQTVEDFDVNGKKVKAVKHNLTITKEKFVSIMLNVLKSLNTDENIKILDENFFEGNAKTIIEQGIKAFSEYDYENAAHISAEVAFYVKFASTDLLGADVKLVLNEYDFFTEKRADTVVIINLDKKNDTDYAYEVKLTGSDGSSTVVTGNLQIKDSQLVSMDMKSTFMDLVNVNVALTNSKNAASIKLGLELDKNTFDIKFDVTSEDISSVEKKDIKDAVKMSEVSQTDQITIMSGLEKNQAYIELMTDFMNLFAMFGGQVDNSLDMSMTPSLEPGI